MLLRLRKHSACSSQMQETAQTGLLMQMKCSPDGDQVTGALCDVVALQVAASDALVLGSGGCISSAAFAPFASEAPCRTARGLWAGFDGMNPMVVDAEVIS